ncbi:MAG: helix-turn-helix domain-containing protein [bacterium]|nr:helix-turn-helix domain-containing protein [bacterium]
MAIEILTKADLYEFRKSLLEDITKILKGTNEQSKKWLKSTEVRKLLNISPGTLQNLRINGTLSYTKIGGIIYYANQDINKLLENNKVSNTPTLFK